MTILNYFFIGVIFTFFVDLLLNIKGIKDHPQMEDTPEWNMKLRIFCILLWPLSILLFIIACLTSFLSSIFKK